MVCFDAAWYLRNSRGACVRNDPAAFESSPCEEDGNVPFGSDFRALANRISLSAGPASRGRYGPHVGGHGPLVRRGRPLRRSSRETVESARPRRRPICWIDWPCTLRGAIPSRSTNESYCPVTAFAEDLNIAGGMSPAFRNNLLPRQVEGAIGNILQIGSTPCPARSSSMRSWLGPAAELRRRKISACLTQDLVGWRSSRSSVPEPWASRPARSERRPAAHCRSQPS